MSPYAANVSVIFCLGTVTVLRNSGQGKDNDNDVQSIQSKKQGMCVSKAQGMCVQSSLEMLESQVMPGLREFRDW